MISKRGYILIGILLLVLAGYFGVSCFAASKLVEPFERRLDVSPKFISDKYEDFLVKGTDNVDLRGWFFPSDNLGEDDKLIILVAGATQNRINTAYYGAIIAKELLALDYSVVMYDNRATGESSGNNTTLGVKESQDILRIVEFAKKKGYSEANIGVIGDSIGGISLLLVAEKLNGIGAMVVDSAAATIEPSIKEILQNENHVPSIFNPGILFVLKNRYGVDVPSIRPVDHVAKVPQREFLFLHGEKDTTIPVKNSEELLKAANPSSKLIVFPDGYHIETFKTDPQKYMSNVAEFLEDQFNKEVIY